MEYSLHPELFEAKDKVALTLLTAAKNLLTKGPIKDYMSGLKKNRFA